MTVAKDKSEIVVSSLELRRNNIDLLRLAAAAQVVVVHFASHLKLPIPGWLLAALSHIPGVPIFFCLSGFLIFQSYANSKSLRTYSTNRLLRLYPALFVCLVVSIGLILISGYRPTNSPSWSNIVLWLSAQSTVLQSYNPEFLRGFGVGSLNGSLWTISVEVQFYVLTPILYVLWNKTQKDRLFYILIVAFIIPNIWLNWPSYMGAKSDVLRTLFTLTFVPWFYMFVVGALFSQRPRWLAKFSQYRILITIVYALIAVFDHYLGINAGNAIQPLSYVVLVAALMGWVYTKPGLSKRVLGKNDFSYGLYIYHMPVINFVLYVFGVGSIKGVGVAIVLTIGFAVGSWFLVERPSLRLKRRSIQSR